MVELVFEVTIEVVVENVLAEVMSVGAVTLVALLVGDALVSDVRFCAFVDW